VGRFAHLVLTRFNVPDPGMPRDKQGRPVRDGAWLAERWRLFETFCLPSMAAQTCRAFRWLVFFDQATPPADRARAQACAERAAFDPVFVNEMPECVPEVRRRVDAHVDVLLTTRLDNDDAVAREFIAVVQAAARDRDLAWLNPPQGYFYARGSVYAARDEASPFVSLAERRAHAPWRTVWSAAHQDLAASAGLVQLEAGPLWLRVIHGRNVSDRDPAGLAPGWRARLSRAARGALASLGLARPPERAHGFTCTRTRLALADLTDRFALDPAAGGAGV